MKTQTERSLQDIGPGCVLSEFVLWVSKNPETCFENRDSSGFEEVQVQVLLSRNKMALEIFNSILDQSPQTCFPSLNPSRWKLLCDIFCNLKGLV